MRNKVSALLAETGKLLCTYLNDILPTLSDDWWNEVVVACLTFAQRRNVEQRNITSLSGLDLAALIRVLDRNWNAISGSKSLPIEARNYVKEMMTVRNRWAHAAIAEFSDDDVYRDIDTIQRFAGTIEANRAFIEEVRSFKKEVFTEKDSDKSMSSGTDDEPHNETEFSIGQLVVLKSDHSKQGAITAVYPGTPENRYSVFQEDKEKNYYASQLQLRPKQGPDVSLLPLSEFHAHLTALQICHPGLSTLYSLNAARVDFIPYQFRPVLKFIRSDRPRMLIADGVGVGKTIEAGLMLRELQARRDIRSVLIICPRPLVTEKKWQNEMKRFDERFTHLNGDALRYCISEMNTEGEWPEEHSKTIIPFSLFDEALLHGRTTAEGRQRNFGLLDLEPPPRFDLVIVDEAHHIRNTDTFTHRGVRYFCENAEAVLFLTATPIQLGSHDLFVLLNVLRPDLVIDTESFEHMSAPNPFINQAIDCARACMPGWQDQACQAMEAAAATPWGQSILQDNPEFQRVYDLMGETDIADNDRVSCINTLEELHTFSAIINRTRRRDIGDFTTRRPETITVDFTPQQRKLHDDILQVQASVLSRLHGDRNVRFMMTTIRRRAASSIYGLIPFLQAILSRRIDDLMMAESDDDLETPDSSFVQRIEGQIRDILHQAENLDPADLKLQALQKIIRDKQELPNNKIMIFSSFRHTLGYLYDALGKDGSRLGLVHGDVPDEERMYLRKKFMLPREDSDALDVLLFSEVGCEGLDYQFCDCIVNYDLPWNPMKIEQRIGRIDRNGQRSETVSIFNLITPDTVDADIYDRCLMRIGVFNSALGAGEEILGDITRDITNIAENTELTPAERQAKLQQVADNNIRLINEQEKLEEKEVELFGIRLPEELAKKQIEEASSFWLSPSSLQNMIVKYFESVCGEGHDYILGEKQLKTLRLSQESRNLVLRDLKNLDRQRSPVYRAWEQWLGGDNQHMQITFESSCALENPSVTFIMPIHPLARQAARMFEPKDRIVTAVTVGDKNIPQGDHPFVIYQWQYHGIREDMDLKVITQNPAVADNLITLLQVGKTVNLTSEELPEMTMFEALDSKHYDLWAAARQAHRDKTLQLAGYKKESLNTSHQARIALLNEQLNQATEEKIIRMRQAQITGAQADFNRRIEELERAVTKADVTAQSVAFGIIRVVQG